MKILELHIDGFGKFHDRTVSLSDGINVIYGKNEAGKSTLHTFIRAMLFGMERGRGRAARNDLYSRYEPWTGGAYGGWIRLQSGETVYRIERRFQKDNRTVRVVDETRGLPVEADKAFWDGLLGGLTETTYNNTISIGQLKSATDEDMVGELKNFIANMNTTGSISLNIARASAFLRSRRRALEASLVPDATRDFTQLLTEIRSLDAEVSSPEYENQLASYQNLRTRVRGDIESTQAEKNSLDEMAQRGRRVLADNGFTDQASIDSCLSGCEGNYAAYRNAEAECKKKSRRILSVLSFVLTACLAGAAAYLGAVNLQGNLPVCVALGGAALILLLLGFAWRSGNNRWKQNLELYGRELSATLGRHLGDDTVSDEAMEAFRRRMAEFTRLNDMVTKSEATIRGLMEDISSLQEKQNSYSEMIEKQQRSQWELEKKLEQLSGCRTRARALKRVIAENDRIRDEISAVELAQETMTGLSATIRDSFGLYLNKEASRLINSITDGAYDSMSVDENLNVFLNTQTKLVPIGSVSSGTMDQVYLALRLAAAKLLQGDGEVFPLVFDDSFTQYDDERLRSSLEWLARAYEGQLIVFTCHRREISLLCKHGIPFQLVEL